MGGEEKETKRNAPPVPTETPEEEYARLKAELSAMDQEYMEQAYEDEAPEQVQPPVQQAVQSTFSQQEMIESIEEYTPTYNIYDQSSGTNILRDTDDGYYDNERLHEIFMNAQISYIPDF